MRKPHFPDWRDVYHSEHLPGNLCTSQNMCSGYIPDKACAASSGSKGLCSHAGKCGFSWTWMSCIWLVIDSNFAAMTSPSPSCVVAADQHRWFLIDCFQSAMSWQLGFLAKAFSFFPSPDSWSQQKTFYHKIPCIVNMTFVLFSILAKVHQRFRVNATLVR